MKTLIISLVCISMAFGSYGEVEAAARSPKHHHDHHDHDDMSIYHALYHDAKIVHGVKELTYKDLRTLQKSGEEFVLLDVLAEDSYQNGHIPGAINFPVDTITKKSAAKLLSKDDNIIVYCGSFQCMASVKAAEKLEKLGYTVMDYTGGIKDYKEQGNSLES